MRNTSNCTLRITKSTPKKPCCSSEKTDKEAALQTLRQRFPCVRPMPRRGGINARLAYDFFRFLKRPQKGNFTISDRVDDGVKSSYAVQTKTGKKYSCYVTGTVSYMGRVVSDAVCNEIGGKQTKQAAQSNGTCNALLKAAGKC